MIVFRSAIDDVALAMALLLLATGAFLGGSERDAYYYGHDLSRVLFRDAPGMGAAFAWCAGWCFRGAMPGEGMCRTRSVGWTEVVLDCVDALAHVCSAVWMVWALNATSGARDSPFYGHPLVTLAVTDLPALAFTALAVTAVAARSWFRSGYEPCRVRRPAYTRIVAPDGSAEHLPLSVP